MYVWMRYIQSKVSDPKRTSTYLAQPVDGPSRRAFIARAMLRMVENGWNAKSWLVVTVRETVEAMVQLLDVEDESKKSDQRGKFTLALGNVAALAALEWDLVAQFGPPGPPGLEIGRLYENALVAAAFLNDLPLIKLLLEKGVHPDADTRLFGHPLHAAAMQAHKPAVRLLLEHGSCIRPCYWRLRTPLHWAAEHGDIEVLQLLMKQIGATEYISPVERVDLPPFSAYPYPSPPPEEGCPRTNLGIFFRFPSTSYDTARALVFPQSSNLSTPDLLPEPKNADTPLDVTVSFGHISAVKYLLDKEDAHIDGGCPAERRKDLAARAVERGHANLVPVLMTAGLQKSN